MNILSKLNSIFDNQSFGRGVRLNLVENYNKGWNCSEIGWTKLSNIVQNVVKVFKDKFKGHDQGRAVWDILVIILIALLACHIILPPWRLWLFVDNKAHLTLEPVGHRIVHHFENLQFPLNSICPMQGNFFEIISCCSCNLPVPWFSEHTAARWIFCSL